MPLSDEDLRKRLAKQQWTSHNVRLSDEVTTMPGEPDFVQTDMRLHAIQRVLKLLYRDNLSTLRIADLGCLEGGFAMALSREGATVLGIEARATNLEKAALLKEHFELSGMELLCADVKDLTVERFGTFDVVLAQRLEVVSTDHCSANPPSFSRAVWPLLAASSSQTDCAKLSVALILGFADL